MRMINNCCGRLSAAPALLVQFVFGLTDRMAAANDTTEQTPSAVQNHARGLGLHARLAHLRRHLPCCWPGRHRLQGKSTIVPTPFSNDLPQLYQRLSAMTYHASYSKRRAFSARRLAPRSMAQDACVRSRTWRWGVATQRMPKGARLWVLNGSKP